MLVLSAIMTILSDKLERPVVEKREPNKKSTRASAALVRRAPRVSAPQRKAATTESPSTRASRKGLRARSIAILSEAEAAGYLRGEKTERIGGRVTRKLLSAAKAKSGLTSQTALLEYALSTVALEDDYGPTLLSMKGSIPDDVEF